MGVDAEHRQLVSGVFDEWRRLMKLAPEAMEHLKRVSLQVDALRDEHQAFRDVALGQIASLRADVATLQRTHNMTVRRATLPPTEVWDRVLENRSPEAPGFSWRFPHSTVCRQESLDEPFFLYWMARLHERPMYHRKHWEFAFVCQALFERGLLAPGKRGLGFGVGTEPLSALFALEGCHITGTDQAMDTALISGWVESDEHAAGKEALRRDEVCPAELFEERVEFRTADMNAIPDSLSGYDFCWSACALEHLGDIEHGLDFIENSLAPLKPGGLAVHTTELNLTSETETIERGPTVLFRKSDLQALAARLTAKGHAVAPFDWRLGDRPMDRYVDLPPYLHEPHLRLLFDGYETTSVGIIVQKAS